MSSSHRINRMNGPAVVAAMVIAAALLLAAVARWLAGADWAQMLRDLLQ
jgi:hypothetical protein